MIYGNCESIAWMSFLSLTLKLFVLLENESLRKKTTWFPMSTPLSGQKVHFTCNHHLEHVPLLSCKDDFYVEDFFRVKFTFYCTIMFFGPQKGGEEWRTSQ